jgi:hypothetical protein
VSEFPDTELSRRLRANWGRRLRPEFLVRFEAAFRYEPQDADFADIAETDRLEREVLARLRDLQPSLTWPESRRKDVFAHLRAVGEGLGDEHASYLVLFGESEYIGALRVRSRVALDSAREFWQEGGEPICLLTDDLDDGLFLDYTEPKQMFGADGYELYAWGAFAATD